MIEVQQMPRKKTNPEDWVAAQAAADIISENSGHTVSAAYVRKLGNQGKIETWPVNTQLKLYKRSDVEKTRVVQHQRKEAR